MGLFRLYGEREGLMLMAAEKDKKDIPSDLGEAEHWEPLGPSMKVLVNQNHRFNTDTILLAHFSMPGRGELCADFGTGCGTIPLLGCAPCTGLPATRPIRRKVKGEPARRAAVFWPVIR